MTNPLRIGLIGAGGIANLHLPAYLHHRDRVVLAAVCDVVEEAAQRRAEEVGGAAVYTDVDRLLAEAGVDAVDICTVPDLHAPMAIAAARAGKHVLVEKPMARSMDEARAMIAAAEAAGVTLMVGQMQRYDPSFRGLLRLIRAGELGTIRAVRLDAMQNGPEGMGHAGWPMDGRRAGGGVVMSVAVHKLDLMRYLIGEVARVTAVTRSVHPAFQSGAEDYACAILEFENGVIGELFGTYSGFRQPWGEMFMIFGDDGAVHAVPPFGTYTGPAWVATRARTPTLGSWWDMFKDFTPVEPDQSGLPSDNAFVNEILHFAECCATGAEPLTSGRENLGTLALIFAIYESARRGEPVRVSNLRAG